jgi:hypothetical protein
MDESHDSTQSGEDVEAEIGELTKDLAKSKEEPPPRSTPSKGPSLWRSWPIAAVLLAIAAGLTVANIAGWGPFQRIQPPSPQQVQWQTELELLVLIGYIEDYQEDHGRLPQTLEQLDVDFGDTVVEYVEYADAGERGFVVTVTKKGKVRLSYDSRDATGEFHSPTG